ncbi:tryptophan--tRNA ligase [Candidatus Synchoanobacter obligatus]|uniref:Tryptophan--tRNA ligase n=1 Tax=Candidatus Synchoanobacter obligatus TaxID=2919597 RepID=A0ABT1L5R8_9GAMM|nr:tryptophan--tRNA ligase [Candidatus Synchoanobacter obligatus]MCP8352281.1 tryptophan--tRNA ligase [Candidatus Synchoanobacter obligatus]
MSRVFSMIQPSGRLGIGHYLGAIRHWEVLQAQEHDCLFAIANLHAITVPQATAELKQHSLDLVAFYLACGIDPEQTTIFMQSDVKHHAELAWILSCITSLGELNRMTQFKDKSQNTKRERIGAGLLFYPALMAADILLYQTNLVPVGSDQKQHIEMTRDLAIRFNQTFGETFVVPEPYIADTGSRIMALGDPMKKMSKSDQDSNNYIALEDSGRLIQKKIMRAVTDSLNSFCYNPEQQKGLANLIDLYAACSHEDVESIVARYSGGGYGQFKKDLAQMVSGRVEEIYANYERYRRDTAYLKEVLAQGAINANGIADQTLAVVHERVGLLL